MDVETLQQLKDTVRRYVRERLVPLEEEVVATDRIPDAVRREMAEMGLFGMSIPEQYGGLGLNMAEEVELVGELCWASPAFRSMVGTNNGSCSQGILIDGTDAHRRKWLPRLASGELVASFALT